MSQELEHIVESIIFASPEGASTKEITRCVRGAVATAREKSGEDAPESITRHAGVDEVRVAAAIAHLNAIYEETGRAFRLIERPAGWRIVSRAEFSPWVRELFPDKKPARLTPSALETLAIIAYRQPMTKSGMEAVRGVSVDGPLQTLLDRNVVRIAGRADLPGRPLLYETTDLFLEHFGIKTVDDLPNSAELRNVKLPEPEPYAPPVKAAPSSGAAAGETDAAASGDGDPASAAPAEGKARRKGRAKKGAAATPDTVSGAESNPPAEAAETSADPAGTVSESSAAPAPAFEPAAEASPVFPAAEWSPPEEDEEEEEPEETEDDESSGDEDRQPDTP